MKKGFLRISFVQIALLLFISPIYAEKIESNGIYYNVTSSNTVEVTNRGNAEDDWMYYAPNELYSGLVVIPNTIVYNNNTYNVTAIGDNAFAGSQYLSVLYLPSSINFIGDGAFTLCNGLQSISVEDGNASFFSEEGILYAKNPIEIYYVPRGIQGDIVLNESITKIPSSAFQYCSKITTIQLPDNIVSIGDGAFNSCSGLKEIFFNTRIESIGVQAFSKCSSMEIITIPESVKSIGASAFVDCSNLQFVILKEGLQTIDKYAFYNCGNISAISLPSTLKSIGEKAFDECLSLATIQNNSSLYLVQGSETNGCVAKYATSIINVEPEQPNVNYQDSILSLLPLGDEVFRYGYNELPVNDKKTYDYILKTLTGFDANGAYSLYHKVDLNLASQGITLDTYSLMYMLERIYRDVPEMYIMHPIPRSDGGVGILTVNTPESYYKELKEINTICDGIIENITPEMSTYDKLKVIHDGFIAWGDYGGMSSAYAGNIKGAFLEKKAVCEGFSRAFLLLCQKVGIPCLYVSGSLCTSSETDTWGNHAWNFVQVDGEWYLADITTDGGFPGICGYSAFLRGQDYFDKNYRLTTTSGINENTDNIYSVLPTLAKTTYDPNKNPDPEIVGFEYIIPNSCHSDYDMKSSYSYKIENDDLILYGIVVRICEGTIETAEIVDLGETIKIPTYSTEIGPASDCICAFDFEITIPNFNRDYCVIEFDKQQIIVDTKAIVDDAVNSLVNMYYNIEESQVYIEFSKCGIYDVELYSTQGQLISSKKIEGLRSHITMPTNAGLYIVRVLQTGEILKTESFYRK